MNRGTIIADICHEYFDEAGTKRHRKIGALFYYRNHDGGIPSAQFRWDLLPAKLWQSNPDAYFIGNFMQSEKVPDPPYVCGQIYAPSDIRGERTIIGHIGTRQRQTNDDTQYYLQLFGVPLRELTKAVTKKLAAEIVEWHKKAHDTECFFVMVKELLEKKKEHSLYCGIELE